VVAVVVLPDVVPPELGADDDDDEFEPHAASAMADPNATNVMPADRARVVKNTPPPRVVGPARHQSISPQDVIERLRRAS
jgi:hypothetical protein